VPASEALERLDQLGNDPTPHTLGFRALLLGMLDRIGEARELALEADERLYERTGRRYTLWTRAEIAVLAGELDEAAQYLRGLCDWLEEDENYAYISTFTPRLGRVLCALGRHDDAEPLARRGRELGGEDDALTQTLWRQVQALVCSARGRHAEAERLARQAVAITERTDGLQWQGDALCDLADVLHAAGRRDDAVAVLNEALGRYERKQIIPLARGVRERMGAVRAAP
jgi:tetratricopeptide (TPR) repeat protein